MTAPTISACTPTTITLSVHVNGNPAHFIQMLMVGLTHDGDTIEPLVMSMQGGTICPLPAYVATEIPEADDYTVTLRQPADRDQELMKKVRKAVRADR